MRALRAVPRQILDKLLDVLKIVLRKSTLLRELTLICTGIKATFEIDRPIDLIVDCLFVFVCILFVRGVIGPKKSPVRGQDVLG